MSPTQDISLAYQWGLLRNRFLINLAGLIMAALVVIGATAFLVVSDTNLSILGRGPIFIGLPIAVFWIWLGVRQIMTLVRLWHDLRSGDVKTVRGLVQRIEKRGFGLIAPTRTLIEIGSLTLYPMDKNLPVSGQDVLAVYAAKSRTLLNILLTKQGIERNGTDLTEQEQALLKLLSDGLSDKLIARSLDLSPATVRTYNSRLFQKMGVKNRADAVNLAKGCGYLDVD